MRWEGGLLGRGGWQRHLRFGSGEGGDDAADALRYAVASKAREIRERKLVGW